MAKEYSIFEIFEYLGRIRMIPPNIRYPTLIDIAEYTGLSYPWVKLLSREEHRLGKDTRIVLSKAMHHFGYPRAIERRERIRRDVSKGKLRVERLEERLGNIETAIVGMQSDIREMKESVRKLVWFFNRATIRKE